MSLSNRVVAALATAALLSLCAPAQQVGIGNARARLPRPEAQPVLQLQRSQPRELLMKDFPSAVPAIELGLLWLIKHQDKDGRWNADEFMAHDGAQPTDGEGNGTNDIALTGLALFALARQGASKSTDPRGLVMLRGASWLSKQQGNNGLLGPQAAHDFIYGHAIGTLGICAVAAATGDAATREVAQRAINYLESHRNPYAAWRYGARDGDNDSSVTTWATLAYLAANEQGLEINQQALHGVQGWFAQVTDAEGRAGYTKKGERSARNPGDHATRFPPALGEAMTAAALLCRQGLGESPATTPVLAKSIQLVLDKPPAWQPEAGQVDHCYWFFATEALRRGDQAARKQWGTHLVGAVVKGQRVDRAFGGSWDPVGPWGDNGGRIYATAMSVLALQALAPLPAPKPVEQAEPKRRHK